MLLKNIQYGVWALSSVLLLATAIQLWRKGHLQRSKVFCAYLVVVGVHGMANLALSFADPRLWFFSFYIGNLVTTLLAFAVLYEVAKSAMSIPTFRLDATGFLSL